MLWTNSGERERERVEGEVGAETQTVQSQTGGGVSGSITYGCHWYEAECTSMVFF